MQRWNGQGESDHAPGVIERAQHVPFDLARHHEKAQRNQITVFEAPNCFLQINALAEVLQRGAIADTDVGSFFKCQFLVLFPSNDSTARPSLPAWILAATFLASSVPPQSTRTCGGIWRWFCAARF